MLQLRKQENCNHKVAREGRKGEDNQIITIILEGWVVNEVGGTPLQRRRRERKKKMREKEDLIPLGLRGNSNPNPNIKIGVGGERILPRGYGK